MNRECGYNCPDCDKKNGTCRRTARKRKKPRWIENEGCCAWGPSLLGHIFIFLWEWFTDDK